MPKHSSMRSPRMIRKLWFCDRSRFAIFAGLFLLALALCSLNNSTVQADSVPEWLADAGRVDLGHLGDGSAAVIVGDWTNFTVDAAGKFIMTERRALRVLNR